jgi:hypothetical protein
MISEIQDIRTQFLTDSVLRQIKVAIIDPGTNCAIRYSIFGNVGGRVEWRHVSQYFFAGTNVGSCYVERMSMLARELASSELFKTVDLYLIESQYESNVTISLGALVGIISTLRSGEVCVRTKRTGVVAVEKLPYIISTINPRYKTHLFKKHMQPAEIKNLGDVKECGKHMARLICRMIGDRTTFDMMADVGKSDDIADTVCYESALYEILQDQSFGVVKTKSKK